MDWECCWSREQIEPENCPYIGEGEEDLLVSQRRRIVEKCVECPRFKNDLARMKGAGYPLSDVLPYILTEFQEQKTQMGAMLSFLNSKTREIKFLREVGLVLQTSLDLDEVLSIAMTAITAGKGFGMNRAFLLMTDKDRRHIRGYLGVGPRDYEEAWRTWEDISRSNFTLRQLARDFQKTKLSSEKVKFHDILNQLTVPLADQGHIFNRALTGKKPILVENALNNPDLDRGLARILGVDTFLVMPLISRNRRIGVIIADNCITHKPITLQDMQSLETFAFPVAFALERASLYERLQEEVAKQKAAYVKLREQQELIVKMEKMALVGKITSSIAHSIRNPLMVIGGFARTLLKATPDQDDRRGYLESIVRETRQLEDVLSEVLDYSESLFPVTDFWDLNELVGKAMGELEGALAQAGVHARLELAAELPMVRIDYKQISYCLKTITTTALATMEPGGELRIESVLDGDGVLLRISDDGKPLTQTAQEALTAPFFQTQELGDGVGLSLCKSILERQGNSLTILSRPGGGNTYSIRLLTRKENI
ncbi:GAF domain-containing sensor histidine kinase [Geomonas azotofigens]|uniref:GAF domain-containing sensor histidine kinase n=1 Tax=Geomonas azotofigens TaxID=2843196 RepID=UPI001C12503D|nr:GAF domain-containing sensor histidine kinase [Geomonas azotofigens]MBU5615272.1 GAF domain-containing protein [Geomonas azotofigens]